MGDAREKPVCVEVITYAPSEYYHCTHCEVTWQTVGLGQKVHAEQRLTALPGDLAREYADLSHWARGVVERFGGRVVVRVVDAASIEGFFKSLRRRFHRYPAFLVGRKKYVGSDFSQVDALISESLSRRSTAA